MDLDEVDKGILYLLQRNAREITTQEMGEQVGVSASADHDRIEQRENAGNIRGFCADIDHDEAGLQLSIEIGCSASNPEREQLADQARNSSGIISRCKVLNRQDTSQIDAVGIDSDDVARITDGLSTLGLQAVNTKMRRTRSFNRSTTSVNPSWKGIAVNDCPVDGLESVAYDEETSTFRAGFDSHEIALSRAVVKVMSEIVGEQPTEFEPLYSAVDPEALDSLCAAHPLDSQENDRVVKFTYLDHRVTVKSYGFIEVKPLSAETE